MVPPFEFVMAGTEYMWMADIGTTGNDDNKERNRTGDSSKNKEFVTNKTPTRQQSRQPSETYGKKNETVIDEMLRIIGEHEQNIGELKAQNEKAKQKIIEIERRSNDITSGMAKMTDMKGNFENVNDEFANSKTSENFNKLYDNDWVEMSRYLGKHLDKTEFEIIRCLTGLMRFGYDECLRSASSQIRQMFLMNENDPTPVQDQHEELFALRRQYARTEAVRTRLKHAVCENLMKMKEMGRLMVGENGPQAGKLLQTFFTKYIDCCWLMVVSNPPVKLNFDVIGTPYADCSEYFRIYSLKTPMKDSTKEEGTICEVVWPSVCLQNGSGCYKKGDVVIVREGMKREKPVNSQNTKNLSMHVHNGPNWPGIAKKIEQATQTDV